MLRRITFNEVAGISEWDSVLNKTWRLEKKAVLPHSSLWQDMIFWETAHQATRLPRGDPSLSIRCTMYQNHQTSALVPQHPKLLSWSQTDRWAVRSWRALMHWRLPLCSHSSESLTGWEKIHHSQSWALYSHQEGNFQLRKKPRNIIQTELKITSSLGSFSGPKPVGGLRGRACNNIDMNM